MSDTPPPAFTPIQRVLRYYPQRVQVLVMAVLNLALVIFPVEPAVAASLNAVVLALLVFFYGEPRTSSKGGIEDGLVEGVRQEPPFNDV